MFSKNTSTTYKYFFMFVFFSLFLWQSFTIKPEASEIITDPLISMTVGDTKNLYFFHGDSASAYFSSNPNIASVTTGGVLNANDVGSAEIIYSVHGVFHQRKINVADIENPSFNTTQRENLILPDNALTTTDPVLFMQKKDSYTIQFSSSSQALATRYKGLLIWKSDKPNIVRVDSNGKVTALKKGSATITCTLGNVSCHTYVNVITDSYTGKATDFSMLTATGNQRTYRLFKQNAHNYPRYDSYLAWHGCATCSLATVLGAYNDNYSGILPSSVIDGVEKQFTSNKDWTREHVNRSLRGQMPLSLYGISSILKSSGVDNNYVRTYTDSEAKHDIISHLKTGNSIIFEVRQKNSRTGKIQCPIRVKNNCRRWLPVTQKSDLSKLSSCKFPTAFLTLPDRNCGASMSHAAFSPHELPRPERYLCLPSRSAKSNRKPAGSECCCPRHCVSA